MSWTDETIKKEFEKHLSYWQEKLRLRDLWCRVEVASAWNKEFTDSNSWCRVVGDFDNSSPHHAVIFIREGWYSDMTQYDVWTTVAHELVHVMNWSMSGALDSLTDHLSVSQRNIANSLLKVGNEDLAYKWEFLLAEWFAADAPPGEIP